MANSAITPAGCCFLPVKLFIFSLVENTSFTGWFRSSFINSKIAVIHIHLIAVEILEKTL